MSGKNKLTDRQMKVIKRLSKGKGYRRGRTKSTVNDREYQSDKQVMNAIRRNARNSMTYLRQLIKYLPDEQKAKLFTSEYTLPLVHGFVHSDERVPMVLFGGKTIVEDGEKHFFIPELYDQLFEGVPRSMDELPPEPKAKTPGEAYSWVERAASKKRKRLKIKPKR